MLIGGFQPFSLSDYPGKTAAIVFTQGCNFRCPYCHNRALWPLSALNPPNHTPEMVVDFMQGRKGLLNAVVITGGEPTLHPELQGFLQDLKAVGTAVKLDTNGSRPEVIAELLDKALVDYIAMDIKAPLEKYRRLCGVPVDTEAICRSMDIIYTSGVPHHFRTTYFRPLLISEDLDAIKNLLPPQARHLIQAFREPSGRQSF